MRFTLPIVLRKALLVSALVAMLGASSAAAGTASNDHLPLLLRHDALSVTNRNVMRMAVYAPGQYANEVMSVFRMRIGRFLAEPLEALSLGDEMLRPYLLGGRTTLRVPDGRTVGENVPGGAEAIALHIGGGAELRLRDGMFLTMDFGEVLHSGRLRDLSYETYSLGLLFDF